MDIKYGSLIKGKDLKGCILCKTLSTDMVSNKYFPYEYIIGMNEDTYPLDTTNEDGHGLHFNFMPCTLFAYGTGSLLAFVEVPDDEDVYVGRRSCIQEFIEFRSRRLIVKSVMSLNAPETWEYLFHLGYKLDTISCSEIHYLAYMGYVDALKYVLEECGGKMYLTPWIDSIVGDAAKEGRLNVIKYLFENMSGLTWGLNAAFKWASENGHLESVKYLLAAGADIKVSRNYPVRKAAERGHMEVVRFLYANGADITACNNYAIRGAARNNHLSMVRFLHEHGADITACKKDPMVFEIIQKKYWELYRGGNEKNEYEGIYYYLHYAINFGPYYYLERMVATSKHYDDFKIA